MTKMATRLGQKMALKRQMVPRWDLSLEILTLTAYLTEKRLVNSMWMDLSSESSMDWY